MDDLTIKKHVEEELQDTSHILNAVAIGVAVKDGIVTLTGMVSNLAQKYAASRAVIRMTGVRAVANDIEVALLPSDIRTDEDIGCSAVNALAWNTSIPDDGIKVQVSDGWVTLEGTVEWYYQKPERGCGTRRALLARRQRGHQ